jgi:hypothetical protein
MGSGRDPGFADADADPADTGTPPGDAQGTRSAGRRVADTRPADPEAAGRPADPTGAEATGSAPTAKRPGNMLPGRARRRFGLERLLVRVIATCGIIAIGVALGAILVSSKVQGWITGLVIAVVSVGLAGMLWSSRQL